MISIIVPTYNSEKTIEKNIESLLDQNYSGKYEIIIVDDGSTDNTREIIRKFKKVKSIKQKHKGPAAARNLGVKHAKGSIILFTDSDCIPDKNWIKYMTEPFESKDIVGVQGTYRTYNKESIIARFVGYEIEERHKRLKKEIDFIGTFSAGYRKNVFKKFGGFDTSFLMPSGEDPELSFKISNAGLRMVFQPKAFVYHKHPDTLKKFLRQKFWRGYWRIPLYKKHADKIFRHSYTPRSLYLNIAMTGITAGLLLLGLIGLPLQIGLLSLFLTFLLTLPFSFMVMKKDTTVGVLSPMIMILRDFFTGLGIVWGIISQLKKKSE